MLLVELLESVLAELHAVAQHAALQTREDAAKECRLCLRVCVCASKSTEEPSKVLIKRLGPLDGASNEFFSSSLLFFLCGVVFGVWCVWVCVCVCVRVCVCVCVKFTSAAGGS